MGLKFSRSAERIQRAAEYLPGGVNSNFRLGISPTPLVFERASGPNLYDIDGNRLIDYYLGMGPMILGHSPVAVEEAVRSQIGKGILYGGQNELEFNAAELVCSMLPSAQRVRFSSSGTEAVQAAFRLARAVTGRSTIVKFEGHYHGWLDNVLLSVSPHPDVMGGEDSPAKQAGTPGQDLLAGQNIEILSWNRLDLLKERLERRDVAAVIMEPAMCNTGAIFPAPGYLEGARDLCTKTATVMIFDEVITGFRVGTGGAQQRLGVTPDITIFGKAVASGFPVAGLAGKSDLMDEFARGRKVMHGGTYNAQSIAMAATVATLKELKKPGTFDELERQGSRLMNGMKGALANAGIVATVTGFPQIFHIAFGLSEAPKNYRDIVKSDRAGYVRFTTGLLQRGVRALERGAWFISTEHSNEVIDETLSVVNDTLSN